jgi:hypothetical protein
MTAGVEARQLLLYVQTLSADAMHGQPVLGRDLRRLRGRAGHSSWVRCTRRFFARQDSLRRYNAKCCGQCTRRGSEKAWFVAEFATQQFEALRFRKGAVRR